MSVCRANDDVEQAYDDRVPMEGGPTPFELRPFRYGQGPMPSIRGRWLRIEGRLPDDAGRRTGEKVAVLTNNVLFQTKGVVDQATHDVYQATKVAFL